MGRKVGKRRAWLLCAAFMMIAVGAGITTIATRQSVDPGHTVPQQAASEKAPEPKEQPKLVEQQTPTPTDPPAPQPAATTPKATPKPQQTQTQTKPYIAPTVSYVSLSATSGCAFDIYEGDIMSTRVFNAFAPVSGDISSTTVITWAWEYEGDTADMDGLPSGTFTKQVTSARQSELNASLYSTGFTDGFRYRIKVISPNVVFSGWQTVPNSDACGA